MMKAKKLYYSKFIIFLTAILMIATQVVFAQERTNVERLEEIAEEKMLDAEFERAEAEDFAIRRG